jgi:hypothetical protein
MLTETFVGALVSVVGVGVGVATALVVVNDASLPYDAPPLFWAAIL